MSALRLSLSAALVLLLLAGYLTSQYAYFFMTPSLNPSSYAARVDQAPVRYLALFLFLAALALSLIPAREDGER